LNKISATTAEVLRIPDPDLRQENGPEAVQTPGAEGSTEGPIS
jgi:hypothetical protein